MYLSENKPLKKWIKELEEKKKRLQDDIKYTNKLISETENSKKKSLNQ